MSFARDSLSSLEKPFPAGWHVIIGDGTGKSSIIRAIAATLIGVHQIEAVFPVWEEWLSTTAQTGQIELEIQDHPDFDKIAVANGTIRPPFTPLAFHFERDSQDNVQLTTNGRRSNIWLVGKNQQKGWFSLDGRTQSVLHQAPTKAIFRDLLEPDDERFDFNQTLEALKLEVKQSIKTLISIRPFGTHLKCKQVKRILNGKTCLNNYQKH
ncbi:MAG: hypothetical protein RIS64_3509 [Bacteroidota bacterium]|jgi:hypothetical protein